MCYQHIMKKIKKGPPKKAREQYRDLCEEEEKENVNMVANHV